MLPGGRIVAMTANPLAATLLPLLVTLPIVAGQDASTQSTTPDVVEIGADTSDRMTVPVHFAGKGPYRFLIDTGSQNTVLSTSLAAQLSLVPSAKARLISLVGVTTVDTVELDQIDLGKRSYYGLLSPLLERRHIGADGILGLDSLQGQRVLLDFKQGMMAIDDAKALGGNKGFEIVVTARRRFGQLIMADAKIDGIETDVVIDTGAESSIGNLALGHALSRKSAETATLQSVTGQSVEARISIGKSLVIQNMQLSNVSIAYIDSPAFRSLGLNKRPAMLLGMRELRSFDRVAIDFETRKVLFDLPREASYRW
jgi:predicted aspartyl protease